jgi:amino-acid N-acetyltransferase
MDSNGGSGAVNGASDQGLNSEVVASPTVVDSSQMTSVENDITSNNTTMTLNPPALNATTTKAFLEGSHSILAIDPADIRISLEPTPPIDTLLQAVKDQQMSHSTDKNADLLRRLPFVSTFRGSANYIANHRNTVAVYHVPGGLLSDSEDSNSVFRDLMNDVALTWLLGMKIVIVVGCRHQIEQRLLHGNNRTNTATNNDTNTNGATPTVTEPLPYGLRVTNAEVLRIVKEEAGFVRFEVERQLARSLRMQGGGTNSATSGSSGNTPLSVGGTGGASMNGINGANSGTAFAASSSSTTSDAGYYDGNVVSGNFYSAQPFGILDGVDYQYTGFVRKVEVEKIRQLHSARDICLLTTLGVSPSGEVFNVNSESLAATVAGALEASKVLYFTEKELYLRHRVHGNKIQSLRLSDARNLLNYYGIKMNQKGFVTLHHGAEEQARRDELTMDHMDMLLKIGWCTGAIGLGVKRAHIISPQHGSLLQELYTRDGSGTLVSADLYEGIGRATVLDVNAIHHIISPLIEAGTLIDRPKAQLEKDIDSYYIYTRDTHIIACGQLKKFEDGYAEVGCLVVNKDFRSRGRGDAMLGYLERLCLLNGCTNIFVLSTQTMEWFVERGFVEADVSKLPPSRQATYNHKRASKVYIKKIESDRDLDASELWWNR